MDFLLSEAVAMGKRLEPLEKKQAKERKGAGLKKGKSRGGKLPEREKSDTRDSVGRAVGLSGKTYERAKNVCRLDFLLSEAVAMGKRLEPLEKKQAKERQVAAGKERGRGKIACGKLPQAIEPKTRDSVGRAVGLSGKTYERAKAVVESGDKALIAEMDRTGKALRNWLLTTA